MLYAKLMDQPSDRGGFNLHSLITRPPEAIEYEALPCLYSILMENNSLENIYPRRKSLRLSGYDCGQQGVYFIASNHIHGLISLQELKRAGTIPAPTKPFTLSEIAFKTYSSRRINQLRNTRGVNIWQRVYYEHIFQSEKEYHQIGEYILFNPAKWESDPENPNANRKQYLSLWNNIRKRDTKSPLWFKRLSPPEDGSRSSGTAALEHRYRHFGMFAIPCVCSAMLSNTK
jgi:hypothetical protein